MKHINSLLHSLLLLIFLTLTLGPISITRAAPTRQTTPPNGYNDLRDLVFVIDEAYSFGQWADGSMDLFNDSVPVDTSVTFDGSPSYRINGYGNDWWGFGLSSDMWETFNIAPYMTNGHLELTVRGAVGGENMTVNLVSKAYGRSEGRLEIRTDRLSIADYGTINTNWSTIALPLAEFSADPDFDAASIITIEMSNAYVGPVDIWIGDIRITAPDKEPAGAPVRFNQLGYLPDGKKHAVIAGYAEALTVTDGTSFDIIDVTSNIAVYSGQLSLRTAFDAQVSGERVYDADFSAVTTPGTYLLRVNASGIADSAPFTIADSVYDSLLIDSMRYFYLQRQGIAIDAANGGPYARGVGHPQDAFAKLESGGEPRDVSQGWYDAGDYGKYTNAGAMAVHDLLWAYELFPNQFMDNQSNIAESGNGTADILDEIKWELDWLLKMQDEVYGGFYQVVQATQEVLPDQATEPRFIDDTSDNRSNIRPTATTAAAVGALAHAAQVYQSVDETYAATLLQAARDGWAYLEANPDGVAFLAGESYEDNDDAGERFWAAAALYRTTGESQFNDYVVANYSNFDDLLQPISDIGYSVPDLTLLGFLAYIHADNPDAAVYTSMQTRLESWRISMLDRMEASAWGNVLSDGGYFWGSNMVLLNIPLTLAVASDEFGTLDAEMASIMQGALNYILGVNPLQLSYVTGQGSNSIENSFSMIYGNDLIPGSAPGIMAGGPNAFSNSLMYSRFEGKRFNDVNTSYTTNEHTVYWNSALVFATALLADSAETAPTAITLSNADASNPSVSTQNSAAQSNTPSSNNLLQPIHISLITAIAIISLSIVSITVLLLRRQR